MHPVTPSYIKFDFDEDGQYSSSDSAKHQQEVLDYLMLGAKIGHQESQSSRRNKDKFPANSQAFALSKLKTEQMNDGLCANEDQKFGSPTSPYKRKPIIKSPTSAQSRHLDMVSQIILLLRQVCRYISRNRRVQLVLMVLVSLYVFVCHRLVRHILHIRSRENMIGTLEYKPKDLCQALCHYVILVLSQIGSRGVVPK